MGINTGCSERFSYFNIIYKSRYLHLFYSYFNIGSALAKALQGGVPVQGVPPSIDEQRIPPSIDGGLESVVEGGGGSLSTGEGWRGEFIYLY
jgi:hypothetical protein